MSKFNEICESILNEANRPLKDLRELVNELKVLDVKEREQKLQELDINPNSEIGKMILGLAKYR